MSLNKPLSPWPLPLSRWPGLPGRLAAPRRSTVTGTAGRIRTAFTRRSRRKESTVRCHHEGIRRQDRAAAGQAAGQYIELRTLGNSPTRTRKPSARRRKTRGAPQRIRQGTQRDGGQGRQGNRHQYISRQGPGCPVERPRRARNRDDVMPDGPGGARRPAKANSKPQPLVILSSFPAAKTLTPIRSGETIGTAVYIYREPSSLQRPVPPDRFTGA